jgi:hypothetical protein
MSSQPAAGLHSDFADSEGTFSSNLEQSSGLQEPIHMNNSILTNFAQNRASLNLCGPSAGHNQVRAPISHSHFVGLSQSNRVLASIQVESSNPTPHGSASAFSRQLAVPSSLPSGSEILARLAQQRAALRRVFEPQPPCDDPAEVPVRMLPNGLVDIVPRLHSQSMAAYSPSIYAAATLTPSISLVPKRKHRAPRTHRPGPKLKPRPVASATSKGPAANGVPKVKCGSVHNGSVHALDALAINASIVQSVENNEYANFQIDQSPSRSHSSTPPSDCETGSPASVVTDEVRYDAQTQSPSWTSTPNTFEASILSAVCFDSYETVGCAEQYGHQSPGSQSSCARPSGCSSSASNSSTNPSLIVNSCDDVDVRHGGHSQIIRDPYAQRHQSPVLNFVKQNDRTESRASQESDPPKRDTSTMDADGRGKNIHKSAATHLSSLPNAQLVNTNNTAHLSLTHSNHTQILSPLITSHPQTPPKQLQHSENQNCNKAQGSSAFQAHPSSVCPGSAMQIQYCAQTPLSQVQRPGNQHLNDYSIEQGHMEFQSHPSSAFSSPTRHQYPQTSLVPNNLLHNSMMRQPEIQGNQSMRYPVPSHHVRNSSQNHMTRQYSSAVNATMQTTQSMLWFTPNNFIPLQSSAFNPAIPTTQRMHQHTPNIMMLQQPSAVNPVIMTTQSMHHHTPNSMMLPQFQAANLAMQPTQSMHQHTQNSTMPQQSSVDIVTSSQAPPMPPQLYSPVIVDLTHNEPIASTQAPPMPYMLRFDPIRSANDKDHRQFWHPIHGTSNERRGLSLETRGLSLPLSLWIEREQETGRFEPTSRIYCPEIVDEFTTQPATTKTWQEFLDWFQENRRPKTGNNRGGSRKRQHAGNNETSHAEPSNKRLKNTPPKRRQPLQNTTRATQTNQQSTQFGNQMIAQIVQPQFQNIVRNASQLAIAAAAPVLFNPTIQNPAQLAFAVADPVPLNPTIPQNPAQPAVAAATLVSLNPTIPNAAELAVAAAAPVSLGHVHRAIEWPPPTVQPIEPSSRPTSPPEPEVDEYGWTSDESNQFEAALEQAMKLQEEEDNRKILEKERLEEARKKAIEQQEEEDRRVKERRRLEKESQATNKKEQIESEKRIKESQDKKRDARLAKWADEQAREAARDQSRKEEAARTKAEQEAKKAEKEAKEAARIEAEKKEKARVEAEKAAKEKLCLDCQKKADELDELQKRIAKLKKDKPTLTNPLLIGRLDKEIVLAQEKVKAFLEWAGLTIQEDGKIEGVWLCKWVCGHFEGDNDDECEGDESYWSIEEKSK